MYTLYTDSPDASGQNLGKYKLSNAPIGGEVMDRTVTSHSLFCVQGAKNCSYVTERCCWMSIDYLRHTGRRKDYNEQMVDGR